MCRHPQTVGAVLEIVDNIFLPTDLFAIEIASASRAMQPSVSFFR